MDFKRYFLNSKVYIQQFNSDWTYQNVQNVFVMQNKIQVGLNYVNAISSNHVMNKTCLPLHFFTQFLSYFSQLIYWVFSVIYWDIIHWCSQLFPLLFNQFLSYIYSVVICWWYSQLFTDFLSYRCQNCFRCWAHGCISIIMNSNWLSRNHKDECDYSYYYSSICFWNFEDKTCHCVSICILGVWWM